VPPEEQRVRHKTQTIPRKGSAKKTKRSCKRKPTKKTYKKKSASRKYNGRSGSENSLKKSRGLIGLGTRGIRKRLHSENKQKDPNREKKTSKEAEGVQLQNKKGKEGEGRHQVKIRLGGGQKKNELGTWHVLHGTRPGGTEGPGAELGGGRSHGRLKRRNRLGE